MKTPVHYQGASKEGRKYLHALLHKGPRSPAYDTDLFTAAEKHFPWLLRDAYLFNACKYLWRLGHKGDRNADLNKATHYLEQWLGYYGIYCEHGQDVQQLAQSLKEEMSDE